MSFRKYVAHSARDAMNRIRIELGTDAIILSNRTCEQTGRVEIIAAAPDEMRALVSEVNGAAPQRNASRPAPALPATRKAEPAPLRAAVTPKRAISFQEFVRQQSAEKSSDTAARGQLATAAYAAAEDTIEPRAADTLDLSQVERRRSMTPEQSQAPSVFRRRPSREQSPQTAATPPAVAPTPTPTALAPLPPQTSTASEPSEAVVANASVLEELNRLKASLTDRLAHLETQIGAASMAVPRAAERGSQVMKRHVMTRLIIAGFSTALARRVAEQTPDEIDLTGIDAWLQKQIGAAVVCPPDAQNILHQAGAVALVGPTGVGKTTTIAKLAARFVVRHGAASLGLITLDSYRIGAHDQLRSYGRILGVPVHVAHDAESLQEILKSLSGKRKVLIDTCGISQRDNRLAEALAMLRRVTFGGQAVTQVLLLNAASHSETLDEVTRAWRNEQTRGVIVTKLDEAARIGGAVDALIRHRIDLLGVTNGQRVPEDWHPANAKVLAHLVMKPHGDSVGMDKLTSDAVQSAAMATP